MTDADLHQAKRLSVRCKQGAVNASSFSPPYSAIVKIIYSKRLGAVNIKTSL